MPENSHVTAGNETPLLSRRTFLLGAASVGIGYAGMDTLADLSDSLERPVDSSPTPTETTVEPVVAESSDWKYSDDGLVAGGSLLSNIGIVKIGDAVGLEIGTSVAEDLSEIAANNPAKVAIDSLVVAPTSEELLFRLIPSVVADRVHSTGRQSKRWALGTMTSAIFAAAHNIGAEEKSLPLPQFVSGLAFWYVQRRAGYKHAVTAHTINNVLPVASVLHDTHARRKKRNIDQPILEA